MTERWSVPSPDLLVLLGEEDDPATAAYRSALTSSYLHDDLAALSPDAYDLAYAPAEFAYRRAYGNRSGAYGHLDEENPLVGDVLEYAVSNRGEGVIATR